MKNTVEFKGGITRLWWIPLITGLVCVGLGIWTLCCPVESLPVLAYTFAICMVVAGIMNLSYSIFTSGVASNWGWSMALGILELIAGIWMFSMPAVAVTEMFVFVMGIWIMVVAINSLCEATFMSSYSPAGIIWMILILIATLAFSVIFLSSPVAGGVAVWLWLGLSFITFGVYRIVLSIKIKSINRATGGLL